MGYVRRRRFEDAERLRHDFTAIVEDLLQLGQHEQASHQSPTRYRVLDTIDEAGAALHFLETMLVYPAPIRATALFVDEAEGADPTR